MSIPIFQVDAFAERPFAGNPAAVCPLDQWLPVEAMQAIAAENNLSETAFFVPNGTGYDLRWFTPAMEVDLCGHATLASAFVIFEELACERTEIRFHTRSGLLTVVREGDGLLMDFPANPPQPCAPPEGLDAAVGRRPEAVLETADHYVAVFAEEADVRGLQPDMQAIAKLGKWALIATAAGHDVDFVSRFFAPRKGISEDPVTGSAHCILTPYWAGRLARGDLSARQVSPRGGYLRCRLMGDRVSLWGRATLYMRGTIHV